MEITEIKVEKTLTVEELIKKLQQFPSTATVMLNDESEDGDSHYIKKLSIAGTVLFLDFKSDE